MGQRDDLLAGAKKCLVEKGYSRTTARDVAAVSGANLASIGYHFGSKDNLMSLATLELVSEWGDTIEAAVHAARAADPAARLERLLDTLFADVRADRSLQVASIQAYAQALFVPDIRDRLARDVGIGRRELAAMALGVEPDRVDEETARGLGATLHAMIVGFVVQALLDPDSAPTGAEVVGALRAVTRDAPTAG
ncbi:TetR family transcriptional regulator [Stackebrandtia albiflava]|uniref:TetR family transcriptional regulator n=1 Tax=Stackebrandtia albiflava TaxID=406432 RepID=A0A562VA74_9ACTN|nr:TetR/AcrR family transcriptional regulator [Stackebrandtia albiflava]TWJ14741.1 TetR family transcriptional regulator [Stackebrandtia albiflava]